MFQNLTTDGLEVNKVDTLGGGRQILESDIYDGVIKQAYADKYASGAMFVALTVDINGTDYEERLLLTNSKGENFFVRNNKKSPMPGFTIMEHICLATIGSTLSQVATEPKVLQAWDSDARAMTNQSKEVLVDLIGQPITLAIQKIRKNKQEKADDGKWVDINEPIEENEITHVFNTEYKITVLEANNGVSEPTFYNAWLDKRKGQTYDRFKEVKTQGTAGRPPRPQAAGTAPQPTASGSSSLFGRKS